MEQIRDLVIWAADARKCQQDRLRAFGVLVERFQDMACGYACSILGDFHRAEDAAQEAFIAAYQQLDALQEPAAFASWLRRLVHTACHRTTRKAKLPTTSLEAAGAVESCDAAPAELAEKREMRDEVLKAIRDLPQAEREATLLFYINGYSQQEVAEFLEVPVSTVKNRLHASRGRLKERMLHMVKETLHENAPDERFSRKVIDQLLAKPRPLELPEHPVRKIWDAIRAALPDYEVVESEELVDRAEQEKVSGGLGYAYPGEAGKALRTSTTVGTILALAGRRPPVRLLTAGRAFRPGASGSETGEGVGEDAMHLRVFHMADGICVRPGADLAEMKTLLESLMHEVVGLDASHLRWEDASFHVFAQGVELFARRPGPWQGHGIAAGGTLYAKTLEQAGFDSQQVGSFAFGIGVERLAMLKYNIQDIRDLWRPPYVPAP